MNLIVEKTRKNDVSNIQWVRDNNKQACRPSAACVCNAGRSRHWSGRSPLAFGVRWCSCSLRCSRAHSPTACVLMQSRSGRTADRRGASGRSASRAPCPSQSCRQFAVHGRRPWHFIRKSACCEQRSAVPPHRTLVLARAFVPARVIVCHRSPPLRLPSAFGDRWWTWVAPSFVTCDRSSPV